MVICAPFTKYIFHQQLDSVRRNGAVSFPDCVDPRDSFFAPRNKEYYFKENMSVAGRIYSWNPVSKSHSNTRLDYLLRLADVEGNKISRQKVEDLLAKIWSKLLAGERAPWRSYLSCHHESKKCGDVYCLKPEYWSILPAVIDDSVTWYRCSKCQSLTVHNIRDVCPTYRCDGQDQRQVKGSRRPLNHSFLVYQMGQIYLHIVYLHIVGQFY